MPKELGGLAALKTLDLLENQLTTIPPELGNLTALEKLDLRCHKLDKKLPPLKVSSPLLSDRNPNPSWLRKCPKRLGLGGHIDF